MLFLAECSGAFGAWPVVVSAVVGQRVDRIAVDRGSCWRKVLAAVVEELPLSYSLSAASRGPCDHYTACCGRATAHTRCAWCEDDPTADRRRAGYTWCEDDAAPRRGRTRSTALVRRE